MRDWCFVHPWMTFWLIVIALAMINDTICSWAKYRRKP